MTYIVSNPKNGFYLMPASGSSCMHPRDYIFMPWGYSPWIEGASAIQTCIPLILGSAIMLIVTHFSQVLW